MSNSRFSIFTSAKKAYVFAGQEAAYLLKLGAAPVIAQAVTSIFIQYMRPDASIIESHLWGLPAGIFLSWFIFVELRLLLLGERPDKMPRDPEYMSRRRRAMSLTIITLLLFSMGMTAVLAALTALAGDPGVQEESRFFSSLASACVIGGLIWSLRYGALPVLAAVERPFSAFLRRVHGMSFSFRLIGLGAVVVLPTLFAFQLLASPFLMHILSKKDITDMEKITLAAMSAPLSWIVTLLLNAGIAYAIQDMYGEEA